MYKLTHVCVIHATRAGARVHVATPRGLACHVASTWARALKLFFYFFKSFKKIVNKSN